MIDIKKRDLMIWEANKSGKRFSEIGREFGLSGSRISGICAKVQLLQDKIARADGMEVRPETPIGDLPITARAHNALLNCGCETVADVRSLYPYKLGNVPGVGKITIDEIGAAIGGWSGVGEGAEAESPSVAAIRSKLAQANAEIARLRSLLAKILELVRNA